MNKHEGVVARAPGKVVLTGAYAVLEGAPALVLAIDRYAEARFDETCADPSPELVEAMGSPAPRVDVAGLFDGERKLGLGSSAAALVAALAVKYTERGIDVGEPDARTRLFREAREAHARAQGGGSGVDVAASTFGGVLRYALVSGRPSIAAASLPAGVHVAVLTSGESAKTSDLLTAMAAFREVAPAAFARVMRALAATADRAAEAALAGSAAEFVGATRTFADAFDALGDEADLPLVPLSWKRVAIVAHQEDAAFFPSGAGGGDVGVYVGRHAPSRGFLSRAADFGLAPLAVTIDQRGVHLHKVCASVSPSL